MQLGPYHLFRGWRLVSEGSFKTSLLIVRTHRIVTASCNKAQDTGTVRYTEFPAYSQLLPRSSLGGRIGYLRNYNRFAVAEFDIQA